MITALYFFGKNRKGLGIFGRNGRAKKRKAQDRHDLEHALTQVQHLKRHSVRAVICILLTTRCAGLRVTNTATPFRKYHFFLGLRTKIIGLQ